MDYLDITEKQSVTQVYLPLRVEKEIRDIDLFLSNIHRIPESSLNQKTGWFWGIEEDIPCFTVDIKFPSRTITSYPQSKSDKEKSLRESLQIYRLFLLLLEAGNEVQQNGKNIMGGLIDSGSLISCAGLELGDIHKYLSTSKQYTENFSARVKDII